jgi:hypothetical protein
VGMAVVVKNGVVVDDVVVGAAVVVWFPTAYMSGAIAAVAEAITNERTKGAAKPVPRTR